VVVDQGGPGPGVADRVGQLGILIGAVDRDHHESQAEAGHMGYHQVYRGHSGDEHPVADDQTGSVEASGYLLRRLQEGTPVDPAAVVVEQGPVAVGGQPGRPGSDQGAGFGKGEASPGAVGKVVGPRPGLGS
jgi:hypothetical protein